jgi:wobble nucleotide-excising tRNase
MRVDTYQVVAAKRRRDDGRDVYKAVCPFCEKETTAREDAQGNLNIKVTDHCSHLSNFEPSKSIFTFMNETVEEDPIGELKNNEVTETIRAARGQISIDSFGGGQA